MRRDSKGFRQSNLWSVAFNAQRPLVARSQSLPSGDDKPVSRPPPPTPIIAYFEEGCFFSLLIVSSHSRGVEMSDKKRQFTLFQRPFDPSSSISTEQPEVRRHEDAGHRRYCRPRRLVS